MSRIGKQPIEIPEGVTSKIEKDKIIIKGPKGELSLDLLDNIKVEAKDKELIVSSDDKALWGLFRSLINNMVIGVVNGFEKQLEIQGVGYKANIEGDKLVLEVGFSHKVDILKPEGIEFNVAKNIITISGIDKQLVGETAARIRKTRPPEPYKGKGIRYVGEQVRRKAGKRATDAPGAA